MKKSMVSFLFVFTVACSMLSPKTSILDNPKCELPCWNNIILGETAYPDALQIISDIDGVDPSKTNDQNAPWQIFSQQIWFYLYTDTSFSGAQTDVALYFVDNKAAMMLINRNIERTYAELIEIAGEPKFISSVYHPAGTSIIAINPSKGIAFEFKAKKDTFNQDTQIDILMLFDPAQYQNLLKDGMFSWREYKGEEAVKILYPWKGYGSVDDLYPPTVP